MISPYSSGQTITNGTVGRAVFQSNLWKRLEKKNGLLPNTFFINRTSPTEISVFILNLAPDEELAKIGDNVAAQRGPNRQFYGWAEWSVADAGKSMRKVCATPKPENVWHADIVLPSSAETDKKERERHADQLARMAVPRSKPTGRQ